MFSFGSREGASNNALLRTGLRRFFQVAHSEHFVIVSHWPGRRAWSLGQFGLRLVNIRSHFDPSVLQFLNSPFGHVFSCDADMRQESFLFGFGLLAFHCPNNSLQPMPVGRF